MQHYRRHSTSLSFPASPDYGATFAGVWHPPTSTCRVGVTAETGTRPVYRHVPDRGTYWHRWLIEVSLRNTAQQAEATVANAPAS